MVTNKKGGIHLPEKNEKIEAFATNDIYMSFELYLDGASNTEVTYSLGWDLGGDKPLITLGPTAKSNKRLALCISLLSPNPVLLKSQGALPSLRVPI